jgi:hypothetical protein
MFLEFEKEIHEKGNVGVTRELYIVPDSLVLKFHYYLLEYGTSFAESDIDAFKRLVELRIIEADIAEVNRIERYPFMYVNNKKFCLN